MMQQDTHGAGPSNAPLLHQPAAAQAAPLQINCLLQFRDARSEAAYRHYMYTMQQAADAALFIVSVLAVPVALFKHFTMPAASRAPTAMVCLLSGGQALFLLALQVVDPADHTGNRGLCICCIRIVSLFVWLLNLPRPSPAWLLRRSLSTRLFLLSPAGGNVWLALIYPLLMSQHLMMLGMSSFLATSHSAALQERLSRLEVSPEQLASAYQQLSRSSKLFELPAGRLLQRWPDPPLTDQDRLWCLYAFVTLVYGLLLPVLLLYIKEAHFRLRFLYCLRPAVSNAHMAALQGALYRTATAACCLTVSMLPATWRLLCLVARGLTAQQGQLQLNQVLLLLAVLALEVFMRLWLLTVLQLLLQRVVGPALLRLRLWTVGPQARAAAPFLGSAPAPQQQQQQQQPRQQQSSSGVVDVVSAAGLRQRLAAQAAADNDVTEHRTYRELYLGPGH